MSIYNCLAYATQIAEGLKAAHTKGITHRDIKSGNIMVTECCQVKIMDFGLAKIGAGAHLTKSGATLGTAAYMSPEQARGEEVDQRPDIWSFGVVLYEMLTGQLPFRGEYEAAMMYSILNEEPDFSNIPGDAVRVMQKALAQQVEDRYYNVQDLFADLKTLKVPNLSGLSGLKTRPAATKKWPLLIGAVTVLALLAMVAVFLYRGSAPHSVDWKSIAVLPFENLSADPEQEYFCEGMAEEIINALTQVRELRAVARMSTFSFKGQNTDVRAIGER